MSVTHIYVSLLIVYYKTVSTTSSDQLLLHNFYFRVCPPLHYTKENSVFLENIAYFKVFFIIKPSLSFNSFVVHVDYQHTPM
ncbi:hypothetical protein HanPI659440_Chr11g0439031 [Helianthus annuus]|nr:hypothetical protein HanPI659440_Chr11g0439031 [Helianthus annuus]